MNTLPESMLFNWRLIGDSDSIFALRTEISVSAVRPIIHRIHSLTYFCLCFLFVMPKDVPALTFTIGSYFNLFTLGFKLALVLKVTQSKRRSQNYCNERHSPSLPMSQTRRTQHVPHARRPLFTALFGGIILVADGQGSPGVRMIYTLRIQAFQVYPGFNKSL